MRRIRRRIMRNQGRDWPDKSWKQVEIERESRYRRRRGYGWRQGHKGAKHV